METTEQPEPHGRPPLVIPEKIKDLSNALILEGFGISITISRDRWTLWSGHGAETQGVYLTDFSRGESVRAALMVIGDAIESGGQYRLKRDGPAWGWVRAGSDTRKGAHKGEVEAANLLECLLDIAKDCEPSDIPEVTDGQN